MSNNKIVIKFDSKYILKYLLPIFGVIFFALNLYLLLKFKFNYPILDEWADYNPWRGFDPVLNFRWLFATTQNHSLFFSRLINYFFQMANGRDFYIIAIVQYITYSIFIFYALFKLNKFNVVHSFGIALIFFNSGMVEIFYWPFMGFTYWHLFLTGMSIWFILSQNSREIIFGLILASLAFLQAGQGAASNIIIVLSLGVLYFRFKNNKIYIIGAIYLIICEIAWFALVPFDNKAEIINLPFSINYFIFNSDLILNGFNFKIPGFRLVIGLPIIILSIFLISYLLYSIVILKKTNYDRLELFYITFSAAIFSSMGAMAMGRDFTFGFSDRYHIYPLFFLAALFSFICYELAKRERFFNYAFLLNIVYIFIYCGTSFNIADKYSYYFSKSSESLQCARDYLLNGNPQDCIDGPYKWMVPMVLERAKLLKSSFCFTILDRANNPEKNDSCFEQILAKSKK